MSAVEPQTAPIGYVIAAEGTWEPAMASIQDYVYDTVDEARADAVRASWAEGVTKVRILALVSVAEVTL